MKKIVRLTESDLIRIVKRIINEQNTETAPTISSIEVFDNVLTPSGINQENVSVDGVLGVVNCDANPNTKVVLTVNNKRLDKDLVEKAIGDDTKIGVWYYLDNKLTKAYEQVIRKDQLLFQFEFPKSKIQNISDDTTFAVCVEKGGKVHKYNGKNIFVSVKGFMF